VRSVPIQARLKCRYCKSEEFKVWILRGTPLRIIECARCGKVVREIEASHEELPGVTCEDYTL